MAAELVGGAILSSFLEVAFHRLASPDILDFFNKPKLDETLLNKLNIIFLSLNAVIDDAEQKQITNPNVKSWLDEVLDAVYVAEDVLDEIDYNLTKQKVESQFQSRSRVTRRKVQNFFSVSVSSFHKQIESRMKRVVSRLEYLESKKDILGLKEGCVVAAVASASRLPTTSLVVEGGICGRDDDKKMIIDWLLSENDDSQLSIVSIVGMGGLGKTTVAQLVYNDCRVKDEFDIVAWVCVSDDFDVTRVTKAIIEAITMSNVVMKELNVLQIKLKGMLTGKRFLIVLDDLWNESYLQWEALQAPFNHGALGSKVLVTTRSEIVASTVRSTKTHRLKPLIEEDSWLLFKKYAFCNGDASRSNSAFEEIGRRFIKKCKGLPLALKTIGSLLYTKLSVEEWNAILESEIWEEGSDILPSLRLSYYYLPSLLKRCFAYCSIFPKDYEFSKEQLIQLWMAGNFFKGAGKSKDIEEVGDILFHELLSKSFFQFSSRDGHHYVMHDLINDLAQSVSRNFCIRFEAVEAPSVSNMTRHFSYLTSRYDYAKRFEAIYDADGLRTFLSFTMYGQSGSFLLISSNIIHDLLSKFRCLRIFSLVGYFNITQLPESIGCLIHLRYLDLSHTGLERLPDSICLLYNLQTLKLRGCYFLQQLPLNFHRLVSLRHLDFYETNIREMPKKLGDLKNLHVLSSFYVGNCCETSIRQLQELSLRGSLSILALQNVNPIEASAANLKNKIRLEELELSWSLEDVESENDREVLEKLEPHQNLKRLSISNYRGTRFPNWFSGNSLSNIVYLELRRCKYCFLLPPLGILPSLKSLSIRGFDRIETIGPEFYGISSCTTPFVSLQILRFDDMAGWKEWKCENFSSAFSCLQELCIRDCPKLKGQVPTQLPSLRKLVINNCLQLEASVDPPLHEMDLERCTMLHLRYLPSTLKILRFCGFSRQCSLVEKIEYTIANTCLEELYVFNCTNMELPLHNFYNFLQRVKIVGCNSLRTFPLDSFPKLQSLHFCGCDNLEIISISEGHHSDLTSLTLLDIAECPKFVSFPRGGFSAPKLCRLSFFSLESLKELPERMQIFFPSLSLMEIEGCPQVESFPEGGLPLNLEALFLQRCPKLMASRMDWDLQSHKYLQFLCLSDKNVKSFPEAGLWPPSLKTIDITNCPNLESLDYMGLYHLSSLRNLNLFGCPKLQYLPKEGLPTTLSSLKITNCPMLEKCFRQSRGKGKGKGKGKDWAKIAHIPFIVIGNDLVT